jgi:hypothetical protein
VIALFMAVLLVAALTTLQGWFDATDRQRAIEAVLALRTKPSMPPIGRTLSERNGGAPPACAARIASACSGIVLVECRVGGDGEPYRFAVHLLKRHAEAADEATRRRLEQASVPAPPR